MTFDPRELGDLYPWTPRRFEQPAAPDGSAVRMSYLDEGPAAPRETLLMLHGNPTWSFFYRDLVKALSPEHRCVVPDHIGSGLSDKPQDYPYTLATHVDNVDRLVTSLDLRDVTLVVHDWGGAIGMGWATRHPERVKRIVVLNTAAFRSQRIPASIDLCRVPFLGALLIRGLNGFAKPATWMAVMKRMRPEVARGFLRPYDSWRNRIGNLRFVQDIPMHARIPSWETLGKIEDALPRLRGKPMMICWGGRDFCFDDTFLEGWRTRFPAAEVHRFAQAGHYVLEDAGDEVLALVKGFLARAAATAPAVTAGP